MGIEQKINYQLNKYPGVKKVLKSIYQRTMYIVSSKIKSEGDIVRISPNDDRHEYFFGYYDKSPWDITDRYILCMRAKDTWSDVSPREKADILVIDTVLPEYDKNRVKKIAETRAWNVQQSCMLQWLGPDFSSRIIFNDCRDGKYVSVIKEIKSGTERVIDAPVYTVCADGKTALTLDFSRLYNLRPGYGYYNVPEKTKGVALPDATAVWKIDLTTGDVQPLLTYKDFATFQTRPEMQEAGSVHKVNHLMLSPSGNRCMVLYRWFVGQRKYTRLVTFDTVDGKNMYVLSDDDMVSHCFWKDDEHILAFENKKDGGPGYYLMKDMTQDYTHYWKGLTNDGHPSYSPDGKYIITDSYPDRARVASIRVMNSIDDGKDDPKVIARVFAPFKYDNDTRCDLHPRWNHKSDTICFDSVFEGHRGLYSIKINEQNMETQDKQEGKYPVVYVFTSCKRCGPIQIMYNLISEMDMSVFSPTIITLYEEVKGESDLERFEALGIPHFRIPLGKVDILLNKTERLEEAINKIQPSIIHSLGVFPDYAVSRLGYNCQVITLHNYMREDFLAKFGVVKGLILEYLQTYAVKRAAKVWTCSESLSEIYQEKRHLQFDYIRNGVDVSKYTRIANEDAKASERDRLGLPQKTTIFVYTGQFIDRKDQEFLIKLFSSKTELKEYLLLLLGAGINLESLEEKYKETTNIVFTGNVSNVQDYLRVSDFYISCSKSEGMPTSVLEAMSCGLPVVLSDIKQHKELFNINPKIGEVFELGSNEDCLEAVQRIMSKKYSELSAEAYDCAHNDLNAKNMSRKYQEEYKKVIASQKR